MHDIPRILLVDDDADDRELTSLVLRGAFRDVEIEVIDNAAALSRAILSHTFGLVITEYRLGWMSGVDVVRLVREVSPDCPIVFLTQINADEVVEDALVLSIDGFAAKNSRGLAYLPETVRSCLQQARRRSTEARRETTYHRLVENMAVGVFVASSNGNLIEANPVLAALLDYSEVSLLVQQNIGNLFSEESDAEAWRSWLTSSEGIADIPAVLRRADGSTTRVRLRAWAVADKRAGIKEINGIVEKTDLSQDQQAVTAEPRAGQVYSNEDLEQIISAVSHDLQQPLVQVARYLELLEQQEGDSLSDDGRRFLGHALGGANRLQEMVAATLRYSRIDTRGGVFLPVDLSRVLERVTTLLSDAINEFDVDVTLDELPTVMADEIQMEQLFQNLIGNAIKFRGDAPPKIRVFAEEDASFWMISVQDNGIGITSEDHERIFKMFQRLHSESEYPGTGIGLAMCRRIAARHGGSISVASALGEGATFTLILPKNEISER
jgi:PAS domain S-box-containing protein